MNLQGKANIISLQSLFCGHIPERCMWGSSSAVLHWLLWMWCGSICCVPTAPELQEKQNPALLGLGYEPTQSLWRADRSCWHTCGTIGVPAGGHFGKVVTGDWQDCCQNLFLVFVYSLLCVGVVLLHFLLNTGSVNLGWMEAVTWIVYDLPALPSSCWYRAGQGSTLLSPVSQELLEFVTLAWTKLCRARWFWGFSFEPGLGAHAGLVTQCSPGTSWFPGAASCWGRAMLVGPLRNDLSTLWFQLADGYQLIHAFWSVLTSSSQNLAEPVLKETKQTKNPKRTKNPKWKQNQTTLTKNLKPNRWWLELFSDWVMYVGHRGYSSPLYSRFKGNRKMYFVNTSCRNVNFGDNSNVWSRTMQLSYLSFGLQGKVDTAKVWLLNTFALTHKVEKLSLGNGNHVLFLFWLM